MFKVTQTINAKINGHASLIRLGDYPKFPKEVLKHPDFNHWVSLGWITSDTYKVPKTYKPLGRKGTPVIITKEFTPENIETIGKLVKEDKKKEDTKTQNDTPKKVSEMNVTELKELASELGIESISSDIKKDNLIEMIKAAQEG